ncbi:MAG TPA: hypothetical protein VEP90_02500, partial [Methylomirabilota bacterium]|nr:hypothetical protein [Methylomirabilota bacterium]
LLKNPDQPWRSRISHLFKDPDQPLPLIKTPLIPIFVRLGDYANERAKDAKLSFSFYLERSLTRWNIPGVGKFLEKCLKNGRCLILFDGLNEVKYNREEVQNEIKNFISQYSHSVKQTFTFNRFLITTRIAGYNPNDFTNCLHYTIAELTDDQIKHCLHRWYEAIIRNHRTAHNQDEQVKRRDDLYSTITNNAKVCDLASRPLSLTLLVLMEQSDIGLPRRRVDLYRRVTSMLLQKHKDTQGQPVIPKEKGIQYLGPLALWMLEHGKRWASSSEVKEKLRATIGVDKVSDNEISQKVEVILKQVREEGGLFVYRTGDDLGFSHLTFQEYFAARYMLNGIKEKRNRGVVELVGKVRLDDRWREPFLLAVAHQSYEDKRIANQIVAELIKHP